MKLDVDDEREIETARNLAADHNIRLDLISAEAWRFRMTLLNDGRAVWIIDIWPALEGGHQRERIQHDEKLPGPRLVLPRYWTLTDAVQAAVVAVSGEGPPQDGRAPTGGRRPRRW